MPVRRAAVSGLQPTGTLDASVAATDGTLLLPIGSRLEAIHLSLFDVLDIEHVLLIEPPDDDADSRVLASSVELSLAEMDEAHTLADDVMSPEGVLLLSKGSRCDTKARGDLLKHSVQTVRIAASPEPVPGAVKFLTIKNALDLRDKQAVLSQPKPKTLDIHTVRAVLQAWLETANQLAEVKYHPSPPERLSSQVAGADYAWLTPMTCSASSSGNTTSNAWIFFAMDMPSARRLSRNVLKLFDEYVPNDAVEKVITMLAKLFFERAAEAIAGTDQRLRLGRAMSVGGRGTRIKLPASEALSFVLKGDCGTAQITVGIDEKETNSSLTTMSHAAAIETLS